jgi:rhomboid domain-containing protein 1
LQGGQWNRLFWGTIMHSDTMHLYYNMSSLLFKGMQLEPALGSVGFALLVAELWLSFSLLYCGLIWAAYHVTGGWSSDVVRLYHGNLIGFSGAQSTSASLALCIRCILAVAHLKG